MFQVAPVPEADQALIVDYLVAAKGAEAPPRYLLLQNEARVADR